MLIGDWINIYWGLDEIETKGVYDYIIFDWITGTGVIVDEVCFPIALKIMG